MLPLAGDDVTVRVEAITVAAESESSGLCDALLMKGAWR
jgi:hypothetical protein